MDADDLEPIKAKSGAKNLDELSIEALGEYVEALKAEIVRVETAIDRKMAARAGADAFFKS
ncbi:MAG: DUF1192 domain-containing protein [Alphaproteobacteria bacterium]|nr:DUF1192 domain-containing protein [Alphaproteobacteria bacterium]MBF0250340.1 DUF1192 domain-containing protein [Alphaproteobacteria bacterium]